jgi:hypothetical protein
LNEFYNFPGNVGNVIFVHSTSGSATGPGWAPENSYNSIQNAFGAVSANNGDVIVVLPGHVETVTAANGLDMNVAGVRVIGLGHGSSRPQINLTTNVAASVRINANGIWVENVVFTGGIDNITNVLTINGKTDVTLKNIEFRDVTGQVAKFLAASNGSARLVIDGLKYIGAAAAGTVTGLEFDGCDDLRLTNFDMYGNFSNSAVEFVTTLSARVHIRDGKIWTENAADMCIKDTITASTGFCGPSLYLQLKENAANITEAITGATFVVMDNVYVVNLAGEKAMLINWTASTDA